MKKMTLFAIFLVLSLQVSASFRRAPVYTALKTKQSSTPSLSALSAAPVDNDRDGIDDALEQLVAERYAPMIYLEPGESNYPVNVDWITQRGNLWYGEQGCNFPIGDQNEQFLAPIGNQDTLLGPQGAAGPSWVHPFSFGAGHHMGHCPTFQSADPVVLSTTEPFPDSHNDRSVGDEQLWYIDDFPDDERLGGLNPIDWVTYYHCYPTTGGGIIVQYWHTFAFNEFELFDRHGGDWDASIQVELDSNLLLKRIWFSRHNDDHPGDPFTPGQIRFFEGTHPVMTIDGGGHAAYRSPDDWATCGCTAGSSITGPIGSLVWTRDTDPFDDPNQLRNVGFICERGVCSPTLSDPSGGTVWKTWTAGGVSQSGGDHHLSPNPGPHGGLINLGEYNPGVHQAAHLLEGQFNPLNGQVFIKYSGRWGTTNTLASDGPRGPVFQGFHDGVYTAWYNQGSDFPADPNNSPWREPPSTTLLIAGPIFTGGGVTYVSSATSFTLNVGQNATATQFGGPRSFFRSHALGTAAPPFGPAGGPIALSGPDGVYEIDYFSLDSLNNQEPVRSSFFTLDNTPPVITCPSNIITNTANPGDALVAVSYPAAQASDKNSIPTVVCLPPSGSQYPRGVTNVICTASDEVTNTATCSFTVAVFDFVIADDSDGRILRFDSATGDYDFLDCRKSISFSGRGTVTTNSCKTQVQAGGVKGANFNVFALANSCTRAGDATVTFGGVTRTLHDFNIGNNVANCP